MLSLSRMLKRVRSIHFVMSIMYSDTDSVPGWAKLEQYAKDTWGDGSWNIVTNPSDVSLISDYRSSVFEFLMPVK
jgi:hypothetical protein